MLKLSQKVIHSQSHEVLSNSLNYTTKETQQNKQQLQLAYQLVQFTELKQIETREFSPFITLKKQNPAKRIIIQFQNMNLVFFMHYLTEKSIPSPPTLHLIFKDNIFRGRKSTLRKDLHNKVLRNLNNVMKLLL